MICRSAFYSTIPEIMAILLLWHSCPKWADDLPVIELFPEIGGRSAFYSTIPEIMAILLL